MTDLEFRVKISDLRDQWAKDSNDTSDQRLLFGYCEVFIADMDAALAQTPNHPDPPPPRIKP